MALQEEFECQGNWLFRWRSYLPLVILPLVAIALREASSSGNSLLLHEFWEFACLLVSFAGLFIRAVVVGHAPAGTSGRNTTSQIADALNTSGMYSVVRHPLYLGNFLIGLGIVLVPWVWWLPLIYALAFFLYYERIMFAEEAFLRLKFGPVFDAWAAITPAFWPRPSLWQSSRLVFSFRNVLRREYTGLFVIIVGYAGVEGVEHIVFDDYPWQPIWTGLLVGGSVVYLSLRTLKRHTHLLDVTGR